MNVDVKAWNGGKEVHRQHEVSEILCESQVELDVILVGFEKNLLCERDRHVVAVYQDIEPRRPQKFEDFLLDDLDGCFAFRRCVGETGSQRAIVADEVVPYITDKVRTALEFAPKKTTDQG